MICEIEVGQLWAVRLSFSWHFEPAIGIHDAID